MATIAAPSVRSLLVESSFNGQTLSTATAFVVNTPTRGPHLITNRHVVTGRHQETNQPLSQTCGVPSDLQVAHNRKGQLGQWVSRSEPLYVNGLPRWIEHPLLGDRADFVALQLTQLLDVEIFPYDPGSTGTQIKLGPADTVSVIGFPFGATAGGHFGIWATGFLASEPDVNFKGLPLQLIDCRSREGQSGSPVVAFRSGGATAMQDGSTKVFTGPVERFIGVYSGRINEKSDLGMVWKASALAELVQTL